jgi:hypothetical protein
MSDLNGKRANLRKQLDETAGWDNDKPAMADKRAKLQAQLAETAGWDDPKPSPIHGSDVSPTAAADVSQAHETSPADRHDAPRTEEIHIHLVLNITNPPIINNVSAPVVNIDNKIEPAPVTVMPAAVTPAAPAPKPMQKDIVITKDADGKWHGTMKPTTE